jgi:hypothetical protein
MINKLALQKILKGIIHREDKHNHENMEKNKPCPRVDKKMRFRNNQTLQKQQSDRK